MWQSVSAYKADSKSIVAAPPPAPTSVNPPAASASPSTSNPTPSRPAPDPNSNAAVQHCRLAYLRTFDTERAAGASESKAKQKAAAAYRNVMPFLTSRAAVRDFIACVAHGMLLNLFWREEGSRLIGAARAALAALPRDSKPLGRPPAQPRDPPQNQ